MTQAMRAHFDLNAGKFEVFLDNARDAARCNTPTPVVKENRRFATADHLLAEPYRFGVAF